MPDLRSVALDTLDPGAAAALLTLASDVVLVLHRRGTIESVAFGTPESAIDGHEEWVGRHFADVVSADTRTKAESLLTEVGTKGVSRRRQLNHPTEGGVDVPVQYVLARLGRTERFVAVGRDLRTVSQLQQRLVEAQQSMERDYWKLRHVETRYRLLFQFAGEAILVLDSATLTVTDANSAAAAMLGEPADRMVGRPFPFGVAPDDERTARDAIAAARASGRVSGIRVRMATGQPVAIAASTFRQDAQTLMLVRLSPIPTMGSGEAVAPSSPMLDLLRQAPDAFVVTDLEGRIVLCNPSFLDLAQLATEEQAVGEYVSTWIGRPGADLPVFLAMLRKHGAVRLMSTAARGAHGAISEVEVSAAWVPDAEPPCVGFIIRDVGRRLAAGPQGARDLTRAVEQLTGLVGRVGLRELVRDTVDLVERHFIEAALEMTQDNRTSAAEVLGLSRQSLYVKLRRHRLLGPATEADADGPDEIGVVG
jgi:transcriptional regulator PpsR